MSVAVKGLDSAGGPQLAGHQGWFLVEGQPVVCLGDPVTPHGTPPHDAPRMVEGSGWISIDGAEVCRAGDKASCGHASTGRDWFNVA